MRRNHPSCCCCCCCERKLCRSPSACSAAVRIFVLLALISNAVVSVKLLRSILSIGGRSSSIDGNDFPAGTGRQSEISKISSPALEPTGGPSLPIHTKNRVSHAPTWKCMSPNQRNKERRQLLGILLVGKADVWTLRDWLFRHHAIFERLVAIDGSESDYARTVLEGYDNVHRLDETIVMQNSTKITDQTIRKPAMAVLGNPVGCWVMICHPDEFWVVDPRKLTRKVEESKATTPRAPYNVISIRVLTASPMESDYIQFVTNPKKDTTTEKDFHIMNFSKFTSSHMKAYKEERFVLWEDGMRWGTRHSKVVPKHMPNGGQRTFLSEHYFYVHFKLHDFGGAHNNSTSQQIAAVDETTGKFRHSKLNTGLKQQSNHGWKGVFLDKTEPDQVRMYPPILLSDAIEENCRSLSASNSSMGRASSCDLPWRTADAFR